MAEGPFANTGRNNPHPTFPGGHPGIPGIPGHPGLGHGHVNPNDPRPDRLPVQDFLGNVAMPPGVYPGQGRW